MSEVFEEQLIAQIEKHEILWKPSHSQFKNAYKKGKAWDSICSNLDVQKNTAKNKWKTLLTRFKQEVLFDRSMRSGDGLEDSYTSDWPHFESMRFLIKHVVPKEPIGNLKKTADQVTEVDLNQNHQCEMANSSTNVPEKIIEMGGKRFTLTEQKENTSSENLLYFQTLLPHVKNIHPSRILSFWNDVNKMVFRYAYPNNDWKSLSDEQTNAITKAGMYQDGSPQKIIASKGKKRQAEEKEDDDDDCVLIDDTQFKNESKTWPKEKKYQPSIWEQEKYFHGYPYSTDSNRNLKPPNTFFIKEELQDSQLSNRIRNEALHTNSTRGIRNPLSHTVVNARNVKSRQWQNEDSHSGVTQQSERPRFEVPLAVLNKQEPMDPYIDEENVVSLRNVTSRHWQHELFHSGVTQQNERSLSEVPPLSLREPLAILKKQGPRDPYMEEDSSYTSYTSSQPCLKNFFGISSKLTVTWTTSSCLSNSSIGDPTENEN